ncbi:MAG: helix-turn-helix domain-containing protein [Micropepsaceae bacterium]
MKSKRKLVAGAKTLAEIDATFSPAQRTAIKRRMKQLEHEELTLADLRKAYRITQVDLAKKLGVRQASVSQVENSTDLYLSTLRKHIEAMGGELALTAKFPNRPPVVVALKESERA